MSEPAFVHDRGGPYPQMWSGISVRDYFAAKAMQGFVACGILTDVNAPYATEDAIAKQAYLLANAMLAAREAK